jgi:hypothetical protein
MTATTTAEYINAVFGLFAYLCLLLIALGMFDE